MSSDFVAKFRLEATADQAVAEVGRQEAAVNKLAATTVSANKAIADEARKAADEAKNTAERAAELQRRVVALKASVDPLGTSIDRVNGELQDAAELYHQGAISAVQFAQAQTVLAGRMGELELKQQRVGAGAKLTASEMLNLGRQMSDVGVTAAMGMNPLMILIQQGPQVADVFATASMRGMGFSAVLKELAASGWAVVAPFAPFIAVAAAAAAVLGGGLLMATHELNKEHGNLAKSLGLTDEQLKKVKETGVTAGDVIKGSFSYAAKALKSEFSPEIKAVHSAMSAMYEFVLNGAKVTIKGLVGGFGAGFAMIEAIAHNLGGVVSDALITAANLGLGGVEHLVNGSIDLLNDMIAKAKAASAAVGLPLHAPTLDHVSFTRLANMNAGAMASVGKAGVKGYADAVAGLSQVAKDMDAAITATAEARIKEEAGTAAATKALREHSSAVKDYSTVAQPMIADLSRTVDLMKKLAAPPGNITGLKNVAVDASKAWEEFQAEGQRTIDQLGDRIRDQFVKSGELSFDDIGKYAEQQLRLALYNTFLAKPIEVIINAVVGNMEALKSAMGSALGPMLTSMLGSAGIGTTIGHAMGLGTGNGTADMALGLGGAALGTMFAGSGLAASAGTAVSGAVLGTLGTTTAGYAAAGGLSAMLSSAAVMGPIAAIAALAIGTLLKPKPSNNGAIATLTDNGPVLSGSKRTSETSGMATQAAQAILTGEQMLKSAGITLATTVKSIDIGTRDATHIFLSNGQELRSAVGDSAAAAETALKAILQGATYTDDAQKSLVTSMLAAGSGFDAIAGALGQLTAAQAIPQTIADAIQKLADPKAYDIAQLGKDQAAYRATVMSAATTAQWSPSQLAAVNDQLTRLEGLELDQVMAKYGAAVDDATVRMQKAKDLNTSLNEGFLKILNPAAYQLASGRREIEDQIAAMRTQAEGLIATGDMTSDVLGRIDSLKDLQLSQLIDQVAQTADTFAQARKTLTSWLDNLNFTASAELSPQAQKDQAFADYQRILGQAKGGDATAAGQITSYADRLISADRAATDNAQARLALVNQIRADLAGLAATGGGTDFASQISALGIPLDKLLTVSTLTKSANDNILKALTPNLAVTQADIPALSDMYSQVQGAQTDRVVAAIDQLRGDLNAAIGALKTSTEAGSSTLQAGIEAMIETAAAGLGAVEAAAAAQVDQLSTIRLDGILAGAKANTRSAA